jgi:tetratricopeptide (TPR) repeat protein
VWADRTSDPVIRAQRLEAAVTAYRRATALAPHWPELQDEWGWVLLVAGRPEEAIGHAEAALTIDPFYLPAWKTKAAGLVRLERADEAAGAYAEYFSDPRNSGDVAGLKGWLAALSQAGETEKALDVADSIVRLAPDDAHAHADLAVLLEAVGRRDEALAAARAASTLDPNDAAIAGLVRRLAAP